MRSQGKSFTDTNSEVGVGLKCLGSFEQSASELYWMRLMNCGLFEDDVGGRQCKGTCGSIPLCNSLSTSLTWTV